jgi:2-keto-3-deoxygluconate permease
METTLMQIYRFMNRVPGGMMVVPLFIGMLINTFAPNALKIGGFTQALTNQGYPTILAMYLFTVGTKMTLRAAPTMLKRGFGILAAKVGIAVLLALAIAHFFHGNLLGLSTLAVLAAMNDTNGGMFLALTSAFGTKEDAGTYVPQSIETGPFVTMIVLVGAGLASIPWLTMWSVIAPIFAGALLGNLDRELRDFFSRHEPLIVPFMAFTLGQGINLKAVTTAGLPGIALGFGVLVITGLVCVFADRLLGGTGVAGAAASSTAGNAAGTPQAIALADHSYAAIAPAATVQVAAAVIVTAVLTPILTAFVARQAAKRKGAGAQGADSSKESPSIDGAVGYSAPTSSSPTHKF